MPIDKVRKLYPFTDGVEDDDALRFVGLTKILIDRHTYGVRFVFLRGYGLEAVALLWKQSSKEPYTPRSFVIDNLSQSYGYPDVKDIGSIITQMKWVKPSTIIELWVTEEDVSVIYEERKSEQSF